MKKHIFILIYGFIVLTLLNACPFAIGGPLPYRSGGLLISTKDIKDPRVKSIKITLENLDGIEPQYDVYEPKHEVDLEIHPAIIKRKERGKKYYFEGFGIEFTIDRNAKNLDKKRIYELKIYINDTVFFLKKLLLTPKDYYDIDIEIVNMEYVTKERNIEITDADIKKWLDGKP